MLCSVLLVACCVFYVVVCELVFDVFFSIVVHCLLFVVRGLFCVVCCKKCFSNRLSFVVRCFCVLNGVSCFVFLDYCE